MSFQLWTVLDPVAVALKFGFLGVLYLFVLWVARSALKDLRSERTQAVASTAQSYDDATGMHSAAVDLGGGRTHPAFIRIAKTGSTYDLSKPMLLGRGKEANVQVDDPYASHRHAQILCEGEVIVLEDLGSTNGTYLNGELIHGPQPLHVGDSVRIGDFEMTCER